MLVQLSRGTEELKNTVAFVKENGNEYMDLYGRHLVDIAADLFIGYLLCGQAGTKVDMQVDVTNEANAAGQKISIKERKTAVAARFITRNAPKIASLAEVIRSGDKSTFTGYAAIVGPVPVE
jgi:hypothetical protein